MTRFTIEPELPALVLSLEIREDGTANLCATDANGIVWYILGLTPEGKLRLYSSIYDGIGLQVDRSGRIILDES